MRNIGEREQKTLRTGVPDNKHIGDQTGHPRTADAIGGCAVSRTGYTLRQPNGWRKKSMYGPENPSHT